MSKHVCELRSAYSIVQWLQFYSINLQYVSCCLRLHIIDVFEMCAWTLLQRTYCLNEKEKKKVFVYLDDNLRPQLKFEFPLGRALLNDTQWFILVTLKNIIPKGKLHDLGDSHHTLSMHCGPYMPIKNVNIQGLPSKTIGHI